MKPTKVAKFCDAWLELSDAQRNPMESEFREIHSMSSEKGTLAIIDEASWHMRGQTAKLDGFVTTLSNLPNHY